MKRLIKLPSIRIFKLSFFLALASVILISVYFFRKPDKKPFTILHRNTNVKFVLQWSSRASPFDLIPTGFKKSCRHSNCFVTDDRSFLPDITDFDAVLFSGRELTWFVEDLPKRRSPEQKYVFAATESAQNFPVCDREYDGYFNWTWTYKLDSDFRWGYIKVYDLWDNEIGPKINMKWPNLKPIGDELKSKLNNKTKLGAWFASNCITKSRREGFVDMLNKELEKYNLEIDVYGACGSFTCPRSRERECNEKLEKDYHFYLSFENSFSEDYVTEKLLTALNNYVVPVVYGSADYSRPTCRESPSRSSSIATKSSIDSAMTSIPHRFLPPGSYLDALKLGVRTLAATMVAIYKNKTAYYDYFRWRNDFKYKSSILDDVCNLCKVLNNKEMVKNHSSHQDLRRWWNGDMWDGRENTCRIVR